MSTKQAIRQRTKEQHRLHSTHAMWERKSVCLCVWRPWKVAKISLWNRRDEKAIFREIRYSQRMWPEEERGEVEGGKKEKAVRELSKWVKMPLSQFIHNFRHKIRPMHIAHKHTYAFGEAAFYIFRLSLEWPLTIWMQCAYPEIHVVCSQLSEISLGNSSSLLKAVKLHKYSPVAYPHGIVVNCCMPNCWYPYKRKLTRNCLFLVLNASR